MIAGLSESIADRRYRERTGMCRVSYSGCVQAASSDERTMEVCGYTNQDNTMNVMDPMQDELPLNRNSL